MHDEVSTAGLADERTTRTGYRVAALGVLLTSVTPALPWFTWPDEVLDLTVSRNEVVELWIVGAVGLVAAWALWTRRRASPELFLAWSVLLLAATAHLSIATIPRLLDLFHQLAPQLGAPQTFPLGYVIANLVINGALLGVAYWQLRRHRPPAAT